MSSAETDGEAKGNAMAYLFGLTQGTKTYAEHLEEFEHALARVKATGLKLEDEELIVHTFIRSLN